MPNLHKRKRKQKRKYAEQSKKVVGKNPLVCKHGRNEESKDEIVNFSIIKKPSMVKTLVGFCFQRLSYVCSTMNLFSSSLTGKSGNKCDEFIKMNEEISILKFSIKALEKKVAELSEKQSSLSKCIINTPIPPKTGALPPPPVLNVPPPPPPPPPCLMPRPRPSLVIKKKVPSVPVKRKVESSFGISLSAINSIKLKKVSNVDVDTSPAKKRQKIVSKSNSLTVSLEDINSVKLRSRFPLVSMHQNVTPVIDQKQLKRTLLRKTNMNRSPGGTPLVKHDSESTGTGLTPHMTRALLKKFKSVKSSPITEDERSPLRL